MVGLKPRDYSNRIWHVENPPHANFELRRCHERRVMTILHTKVNYLGKNVSEYNNEYVSEYSVNTSVNTPVTASVNASVNTPVPKTPAPTAAPEE